MRFFLETHLDFSTGLSFSLAPGFFVLGLEYSSFTFPGFTVLPFFFIGSCKDGWALKESRGESFPVFRLRFYLFDTGFHVWVGGFCGGGGAVVIVGQVIFAPVSLSLYGEFFLFLSFLFGTFCFRLQLPFGFQC